MTNRLSAALAFAREKMSQPVLQTRIIHPQPIWDPNDPAVLYLQTLDNEGESRATMTRVLNRIANTLGQLHFQHVPWSEFQAHHLQSLIDSWKEAKLSPATMNLYLSAIKGVAAQAFLLKQMPGDEYNRIKLVKRPKGSRTEGAGKPLDPSQLEALFNDCKDDPTVAGKRDLAILGLLYGAGLRRHEVAKVRFPEDLDFQKGRLSVIGKGNKQRSIPLQDILEDWLIDYIELRGERPGTLICRLRYGKEGLFISEESITGQAVYDVVVKRGGILNDHFTPHDFRRTFGTELNENNEDIKTVQELLGHTLITTTQRYVRVRQEISKDNVNKLSFGKNG